MDPKEVKTEEVKVETTKEMPETTEPEKKAETTEVATEVKTEGATEEDQAQIDNFTKMVGGLPEGAQITMIEGKPNLTMKINGVPTTKTLEDIVRDYSKITAADMKLEGIKAKEKELKSLEEQTKLFFDELLNDPVKYYEYRRLAGIPDSVDHEYALKLLEEAVERGEMTEEQKELEKLKKEKAQWEDVKKKEEEKQRIAAEQAEIVKLQEQFSRDIVAALKNQGFSEADNEDVKLDIMQNALYYMMVAKHQGVDYTPDQAVRQSVEDLKKYIYSMFGKMPDDLIRKSLPENVVKAVKTGSGTQSVPTSNSLKPAEEPIQPKKKKREQSLNEYFNNLSK